MPLRLRLTRPKPHTGTAHQPVTQVVIRWTPQPLPVGEVPPTETLALLARQARLRADPWSGTRDTDRRW